MSDSISITKTSRFERASYRAKGRTVTYYCARLGDIEVEAKTAAAARAKLFEALEALTAGDWAPRLIQVRECTILSRNGRGRGGPQRKLRAPRERRR